VIRTSFKSFIKTIYESNYLEMNNSSAAFFEAIPSVHETHDSEVNSNSSHKSIHTYIHIYIHIYCAYILHGK
jgi:hypothetical protein